jgi:mono/diheme cytochrome c family protein
MKARRLIIALLLGLVAVGAVSGWLLSAPRPAFSKQSQGLPDNGDAERGRLIFAAGDCASCHASPGQPDRLRLGGGLALASPFGTFRVPNISSDQADGIGAWTTTDLGNALLSGVSPAGKHYYPAFPYTSYTRMEPGDVQDLMAYLRTLPAVSGRQPPHELPLLFKIRRALGFWKLLFFERGPVAPDPSRDEAWNRGRYLAEGLGHCAECHSTRNYFGAIKPKTRYAGAPDPEGVGFIPNVTPARIGHWSAADIAGMLSNGTTPDHGRVGSSMSDVVTNTAMLPESDRLALAAYIKTLPALPTQQP